MKSRIGLPLLLVCMVTFAGCAGFSSSTTPENPATATSSVTPTIDQPSPVSTSEAKQRALDAEKNRVTNVLENTRNISGSSVGIYGETNASVTNQNSTGVIVKIKMSYSYEYHCGNKSGAVDGQTTTARYLVSTNTTKPIEVIKDVRVICDGFQDIQPPVIDRAVSAERQRVQTRLANITNATGSTGVDGAIETTVINQSDADAYVRVEMPYSYEYTCNGSSGAVDGLTTNAIYHVTPSNTSAVNITEDVRNACA